MRQYLPTIEELKKRYSMDLAHKRMAGLRREKQPPGTPQVRIPDNSEPWLPHPPRTVAECAWINENIRLSRELSKGAALDFDATMHLRDEAKCRWAASRFMRRE